MGRAAPPSSSPTPGGRTDSAAAEVADTDTGTEAEAGSVEAEAAEADQLPRPPRRQFDATVLAVAIAAALLVGYAVAMLTLRPGPAPGDASAEAGFARDMITHHDQAVTMGMIAHRRAALPEVRQLGYDIAMTQQGQIGMMSQWLREWGLSPTGTQPQMAWMHESTDAAPASSGSGGLMPGMATQDELEQLRTADGVEVDRLFLRLMTDHHIAGIHMVDAVLERSDHPEVTWLAEIMEEGQAAENRAMADLLARLE